MAGGLIQSSNRNDGARVPDTGLRVFTDIVSCGIAEAGWSYNEKQYENYLNDQDLLSQYEQNLNTISGQISASQNNILAYQWKLEDLAHDKTESADFLADYEQMLAGEGDSDNTLLLQDQLNQENITNAENELASYRDSSALELDSLIRSGFDQYTGERQNQAMLNIYASATGSIVGSYNSAARRTMNAIRAFVGNDMRFNEAPEGTSIQGKSGEAMIGSYAKMLLSSRTARKNNIAKLESTVKASQIALQDFRDQMADAAYENQTFLDRYDQTVSMYNQMIANEHQNIANLQDTALSIIENAQAALDRVNDYETVDDGSGWDSLDKTTWDDLDTLYAQYGGNKK